MEPIILSKYAKKDYVQKVRLIKFLKWIRQILVKLKEATLNLDMCIDTNYSEPNEFGDDQGFDGIGDGIFGAGGGRKDPLSMLSKNLNISLGDDNTILNNNNTDANETFRAPSNSEINSFLKNSLGLSQNQADQLTGLTNNNNNEQGSLSDDPHSNNNDCGYTLSPTDIRNTINRIIESHSVL